MNRKKMIQELKKNIKLFFGFGLFPAGYQKFNVNYIIDIEFVKTIQKHEWQ